MRYFVNGEEEVLIRSGPNNVRNEEPSDGQYWTIAKPGGASNL